VSATATTSRQILRTYVTLTLFSTFASSFIWGINTLFLLSAGLTVTEAFAANAFYTLGEMLFEIPTGVVADSYGRRASYLLGAATLFVATLAYLVSWRWHAPFWAWAVSSMALGLGFTFFSGATEAWLVDALHATGYDKPLETAFAKGQVATGVAMLTGTLAGGVVAQLWNLGVPYLMRIGALGLTFVTAFALMRDVGFEPTRRATVREQLLIIVKDSLAYGLRNRPVRWMMLSGPFTMGVGIYAFYAMQPYLLELHGKSGSYAIAAAAAAIVAAAQIVGGMVVTAVSKAVARRTTFLAFGVVATVAALAIIGVAQRFWVAIAMLIVWALVFAASTPVRQAYLNGLIPSAQRATVLSSDNFLSSAGGVLFQPALARVADVRGYAASYLVSAACSILALPFLLLARRQNASSDASDGTKTE
jgi:MFS family permease